MWSRRSATLAIAFLSSLAIVAGVSDAPIAEATLVSPTPAIGGVLLHADAVAAAASPSPEDMVAAASRPDGAVLSAPQEAALGRELLAASYYTAAESARWGTPANARRALELYHEAAALGAGRGSADALAALARMYEMGWDGHADPAFYVPRALAAGAPPASSVYRLWTRVVRMLRPFAAEASEAVRQLVRLAWGDDAAAASTFVAAAAAWRGALVVPNISRAVELYAAAAELGNASAAFTMGVLHAHGLFGVQPDERLAVLYLYFASLGGSSDASVALGYRHAVGLGTPKNCPAAALYLEGPARATAEAVAASQWLLQVAPTPMRLRLDDDAMDDGVESEAAQGEGSVVTFYLNAADRGDTNAHLALGHLYLLGIRGVKQVCAGV